jgi:hypothetical protein
MGIFFASTDSDVVGFRLRRSRLMMRLLPFQRLSFTPAGVILSVVVLVSFAPSGVEGGCSHLVSSRNDAESHPSQIIGLVLDRSGRSAELPAPNRTVPCSGVWCTGQPATPVVPAGVLSERIDSWALHPTSPATDGLRSSLFAAVRGEALAIRHASSVFHPPRLPSLA